MKIPLCLSKWSNLEIPPGTDQWKNPEHRKLVAEIKGGGSFRAFGAAFNSVGIWFGFKIDEEPFTAIHNGACIRAMGLIGAAGAHMPCYLPFLQGLSITIAYNRPFTFEHRLQLYMGSSSRKVQAASAIHLYFDADPLKVEISGFLHPNWVEDK